jgi:putative endonuclease
LEHFVYILFSEKIDLFYIGQSSDPFQRLEQHNNPFENQNWTRKGIPWEIYLTIPAQNQNQAMRIEHYLKKMKSRKYLQMLKENPDLIQNLVSRFPST